MNNKIKSEKYRKLSVAALVTGILACGLTGTSNIPLPVLPLLSLVSPLLSIAAVVCGSIDLIAIAVGRYSNKGRGFDIAGIVMGVIYILYFLWINQNFIFSLINKIL